MSDAEPMTATTDAPTTPDAKADAPEPAKRPRRWLRRLLITLAAFPILLLVLWFAIHRIRWLGPLLADTARAIFGTRAVAWVEEKSYGLQDKVNLATRKDEQPQQYWDVPSPSSEPKGLADAIAKASFHPSDVGPILDKFAAPGDGQW